MWRIRPNAKPMSEGGKLKPDHFGLGKDGSGKVVSPQKPKNQWLRDWKIGQIAAGLDQTRPDIDVSIQDKSFTTILDTQASHSFINQNVAKLLQPLKEKTGQVRGAVNTVIYKV
ncbi:MAG: hypothetical protein ACTS7I_03065, partial [Candidatus Hodgkinia cicadicola]